MTLREVTRTVIARVEEVSGCPVVVSEDAALKTLAASRIARGENRIHSISFNPSVVREPDYLIQGMRGQVLLHSIVPPLSACLPPHGLGKIRVGLAGLFKLKLTEKSQQRFLEPGGDAVKCLLGLD
jgi:hypothetical protein